MSEVPYTWRPEASVCPFCKGTGLVALSKQGEPAPATILGAGCVFANTVYELCVCMITAGRIYPAVEDE